MANYFCVIALICRRLTGVPVMSRNSSLPIWTAQFSNPAIGMSLIDPKTPASVMYSALLVTLASTRIEKKKNTVIIEKTEKTVMFAFGGTHMLTRSVTSGIISTQQIKCILHYKSSASKV